jgi:hypothetical protein
MAGSSFTAPIKHSGKGVGGVYEYRGGTGMVPSAEYCVWMEDFTQNFMVTTAITNGPVANTPWGWQGAIIDSGATVTHSTTAALGANGVLLFADATASEGASIYGQKVWQLTAGKKLWMEARFRTSDVTDNAVNFGLAALTAVTNPEDLWLTAQADLVAFGIVDGSAQTILTCDTGDAGVTTDTSTTNPLVADTWHTLAISYDGAKLHAYVDGNKVLTYSTAAKIPTGVALAPFFGHINGNSAGAAVVSLDYLRIVSER